MNEITQNRTTNPTYCLSSEAPSSQSLDVSTNPGVNAKKQESKTGPSLKERSEQAIERGRAGYKGSDWKNGEKQGLLFRDREDKPKRKGEYYSKDV